MRRLWEIAGECVVRSHLDGDVYAEPAARVDRAVDRRAEHGVGEVGVVAVCIRVVASLDHEIGEVGVTLANIGDHNSDA